jgi:hypothetical protein
VAGIWRGWDLDLAWLGPVLSLTSHVPDITGYDVIYINSLSSYRAPICLERRGQSTHDRASWSSGAYFLQGSKPNSAPASHRTRGGSVGLGCWMSVGGMCNKGVGDTCGVGASGAMHPWERQMGVRAQERQMGMHACQMGMQERQMGMQERQMGMHACQMGMHACQMGMHACLLC